ncbi:MAG: 2'-5' RNA ligase family protein [Huintestinicola sp.]
MNDISEFEVCILNLRTIMIFPNFDNKEVIDNIREKYDPLAKLVRPHITIVFPFDIEISNDDLSHILDTRLAGIEPFEIELQGFEKCEDRFGNYLFLNVRKGAEHISYIHDALYCNEFRICDLGLQYIPHMTVGKLSNVEQLNKAYEDIKDIKCRFKSVIDTISVEMIGENEESIIITEKHLG